MEVDLKSLPDDASLPKDAVLSLVTKYEEQIHDLQEQLRLLRNELFGRRSEKHPGPHPDQRLLFDGKHSDPLEQVSSRDDRIQIGAHSRKKRGRKPLPEDLPRIEIIHDLSDDQKQCACGAELTCFGQEVSEKLDYIPARLRVERHIRYKYACKNCEGVEDDGPTVKIAPLPVQLIPKSHATAGLLAHIAVSKFADGLPLYRQQKMFDRLGIELGRATMSKWMVQAAGRCSGLIDLLREQIRSGPLIGIDESPLQVLKEAGRKNTSKSYMWVYRGGPPDRPVLLYDYQRSRSGKTALEFLTDYKGLHPNR
jgi:transposase